MLNEKYYDRFNISQRLEHWILVFSFTFLAVTGLPQKFARRWLGRVYHRRVRRN
jgi:cytochrome b subunit of formate dehydrogenase